MVYKNLKICAGASLVFPRCYREMILIEKKPYLLTRSWLDHDFEYLIFENFQKKAVKSPSAKKPRESRRISANSRRKKPRESSANSRRKKPRKSSAKSRRKCSPREISRVSGRKGGEANGFSSSGGESERVRLGSPPFRSRRNSGGEFTSLVYRITGLLTLAHRL